MELKKVLNVVVFSWVCSLALGRSFDFDPCAPVCEEGTYNVPHPKDCTLYYVCANKQAILHQCRDGLYFSPKFDTCNQPIDAGCTANPNYVCTGVASTTNFPTTTWGSTTQFVSETSGGFTSPSVELTTTQDVETTSEEQETTLYSTTSPPETTTEEGPTTWVEVSTISTTEVETSTTDVTTTEDEDTTTEGETTVTVGQETTSDEPTTTSGETSRPPTTEIETTAEAWSTAGPTTTSAGTTDKTSNQPQTTTTTKPEVCIPPCPYPNAIYADPKSCIHYFQCSNNVPIKRTCSEGLEFNPKLHVCDFPSNFVCTSGPDAPCVAGPSP
ncbi:salivary glue protein Sgs-3-like [Hyalella azteca]|uniref:Salivary glue protein Sgs-3-like n=1 Tax=Hyalella azteca TaxID=294128 RepID=A0A8B7PAJ2_HYAAZ|nr:salivary glue protein Sgs-3-like [Hyalella azteca]